MRFKTSHRLKTHPVQKKCQGQDPRVIHPVVPDSNPEHLTLGVKCCTQFVLSRMLGKLPKSSALIFNVLSVPVQLLQDAHEFHTDTKNCTAEKHANSRWTKRRKTRCKTFTVIPKAPCNIKILKFVKLSYLSSNSN